MFVSPKDKTMELSSALYPLKGVVKYAFVLLLFSNVPNLIWSDVRKLLIFVSPERIDVRTDKARFPELYLFHLDLVLVLVLIASR